MSSEKFFIEEQPDQNNGQNGENGNNGSNGEKIIIKSSEVDNAFEVFKLVRAGKAIVEPPTLDEINEELQEISEVRKGKRVASFDSSENLTKHPPAVQAKIDQMKRRKDLDY